MVHGFRYTVYPKFRGTSIWNFSFGKIRVQLDEVQLDGRGEVNRVD